MKINKISDKIYCADWRMVMDGTITVTANNMKEAKIKISKEFRKFKNSFVVGGNKINLTSGGVNRVLAKWKRHDEAQI